MNQARIWTIVPPSVGLPLFLGSVAIIALLVHFAILTHTTWFAGYWQGHAKVSMSVAAPAAPSLAMITTSSII
jgi:light-harvesting protein B-800-850 alpha chain